jgi:flagellar motor switch protein FliN
MVIDQQEIDSLLMQADDVVAAAQSAVEKAPPPPIPRRLNIPCDPHIRQLLRIQVPVIVRLAYRSMPVRSIRKLATGAIIEFEKSVEEDIDLLINNHPVGHGVCVKVGEHFGVRLTQVDTPAERIKSMRA